MRAFLSSLLSVLAGNVYTLAISFVFSYVLLKKLSNAEFGLQSAIVAFTTIVMSLAYFGLFNVITRELTGRTPEQQHEIYSSLFSLMIVISTVACTLSAIAAWLLNSFPGPQYVVFLLALFTLVLSYAPTAPTDAFLIVRGDTWRMAILQGTYATWASLAGVLIVLMGGGVGVVYLALAIISVVTILQYMRESRRLVPGGPRFVIRPREWRRYLLQGLPGALGSFFSISTRSLGTFLVYTFVSNERAGYLGVSFLVVQATMLIVWVPYAVTIMPVMTRLYSDVIDQFKWLSSRSIIWLLAVTLPAAIGAMLLAPDIIGILDVTKTPAAPTLRIFIWMIPFSVLAEFFYRMLLVSERQRIYVIATGLGAALNIALCFALIPTWGELGAAWASVLGTGTIGLVCGWALRSWLMPTMRPLDLLRLGFSLTAMILIVLLTSGLASVYVRIGLGALVYCGVALASGLFSLGDWHTARNLLAVAQREPVPAKS